MIELISRFPPLELSGAESSLLIVPCLSGDPILKLSRGLPRVTWNESHSYYSNHSRNSKGVRSSVSGNRDKGHTYISYCITPKIRNEAKRSTLTTFFNIILGSLGSASREEKDLEDPQNRKEGKPSSFTDRIIT